MSFSPEATYTPSEFRMSPLRDVHEDRQGRSLGAERQEDDGQGDVDVVGEHDGQVEPRVLLPQRAEKHQRRHEVPRHDDQAGRPQLRGASQNTISLVIMEWKARAGTATYIEMSMSGAILALVTRPNRYPTKTAKKVGADDVDYLMHRARVHGAAAARKGAAAASDRRRRRRSAGGARPGRRVLPRRR